MDQGKKTTVLMDFTLYEIGERPKTRMCSDCRITPVTEGESQCVPCKRLIEQRNAFDKPAATVSCQT